MLKTSQRGSVRTWLASASLASLLGCGGGVDLPRLIDYLDELEFDVPLESAAYVPLGKFDIPIAATKRPTDAAPAGALDEAVWMRLQFELTAETAPTFEEEVTAAAEKYRGAMSDAVLTVVRTSTVDELADPRLTMIKSRLSDLTRPLLGEQQVRQLVFNKLDAAEAKHDAAAEPKEESHGHH